MPQAPFRVEVVNAFVSSLVTLLRSCGENNTRVAPLRLVTEAPAAPTLAVSVEMHGALEGPVLCAFDPEIARLLIERIFALDPRDPDVSTLDAVGELGNIVVGNASDQLLEAGYDPVELRPPVTIENEFPENRALPRGAVRVAVHTSMGEIHMLLSLATERTM